MTQYIDDIGLQDVEDAFITITHEILPHYLYWRNRVSSRSWRTYSTLHAAGGDRPITLGNPTRGHAAQRIAQHRTRWRQDHGRSTRGATNARGGPALRVQLTGNITYQD